MEANRIGALSQAMDQGGSPHRRVHSNTAFGRANFGSLPVPPSVRLSPPPADSVEIDEVVVRVNTWKSKRILACKKSATKSKRELQERVWRLRAQADQLSEQLAIIKRNNAARAARNNQLRMKIEAMKQQLQQRLAVNKALKEEIEYYKMKSRQLDAELADFPGYEELFSKTIAQLALRRQKPNPPSQH